MKMNQLVNTSSMPEISDISDYFDFAKIFKGRRAKASSVICGENKASLD